MGGLQKLVDEILDGDLVKEDAGLQTSTGDEG